MGTVGTFSTKLHHSAKCIDRYTDKDHKKPTVAVEADETEEISEDPIVLKEREIKRLKDIMKAEQKKVKICFQCKAKFASQEHLKWHEESSEMHKKLTKDIVEMELDEEQSISENKMIIEFHTQ